MREILVNMRRVESITYRIPVPDDLDIKDHPAVYRYMIHRLPYKWESYIVDRYISDEMIYDIKDRT